MMNTTSKPLAISVFVMATLFCSALVSAPPKPPQTNVVTHVINADTVKYQHGNEERIGQLQALNAPETASPLHNEEPYGKKAAAFVKKWIETHDEWVIPVGTDVHGRTLIWVQSKKEILNVELVRAGLARYINWDNIPSDYKSMMVAAEREARSRKRGLFKR